MDLLSIPRSKVRYACYRARTYAEGGPAPETEHLFIITTIEKMPGFTSWKDFGRKWDLGAEGKHNKVITRTISEEQEWNAKLMGLAITIGEEEEEKELN